MRRTDEIARGAGGTPEGHDPGALGGEIAPRIGRVRARGRTAVSPSMSSKFSTAASVVMAMVASSSFAASAMATSSAGEGP